jgi:hypothetical protein
MPSPLAAFLSQFVTEGANTYGARRYEGSPRNPANRLALSRVNLERQKADKARAEQDAANRIKAAQAASREMNERKKELREEAREAAAKLKELEQDADTPEGLAKIQREVRRLSVTREQFMAAGIPLPAALREPKAEKPPKVYVRDKVAQAKAAGMSAAEFEAQVRGAADKLRAAGFNPDSLIDAGNRGLKAAE